MVFSGKLATKIGIGVCAASATIAIPTAIAISREKEIADLKNTNKELSNKPINKEDNEKQMELTSVNNQIEQLKKTILDQDSKIGSINKLKRQINELQKEVDKKEAEIESLSGITIENPALKKSQKEHEERLERIKKITELLKLADQICKSAEKKVSTCKSLEDEVKKIIEDEKSAQ